MPHAIIFGTSYLGASGKVDALNAWRIIPVRSAGGVEPIRRHLTCQISKGNQAGQFCLYCYSLGRIQGGL
ncbi:MAG TPA: hypothetical protein VGE41_13040 [Verrucomicrobiae bacterium]